MGKTRTRYRLIMHYRDLIYQEEEWWGLDHINYTDEEVLGWAASMSKPRGRGIKMLGRSVDNEYK